MAPDLCLWAYSGGQTPLKFAERHRIETSIHKISNSFQGLPAYFPLTDHNVTVTTLTTEIGREKPSKVS